MKGQILDLQHSPKPFGVIMMNFQRFDVRGKVHHIFPICKIRHGFCVFSRYKGNQEQNQEKLKDNLGKQLKEIFINMIFQCPGGEIDGQFA